MATSQVYRIHYNGGRCIMNILRKSGGGLLILILTMIFGFMGCVASQNGEMKGKGDELQSNIVYNVVKTAEITNVSYFFANYEGASRLHFEVTIKNVAQEPKRFRLKIFLPEGPSAGGLYPTKDMIEPGKSVKMTFPMYYHELPSGFTLIVSEL